jgi:hypothetical protein
MKIDAKISHIILTLTFAFSTIFAEEGPTLLNQDPNNQKVVEEKPSEVLEEKIPTPEFPSLIDLNKRKVQQDPMAKYANLYLLVFNVAMFTVGIAVVKSITGQRV